MALATVPLPYHYRPGDILPRRVWRVTHPGTQSTGNETTGMFSSNQDDLLKRELHSAIAQHINWYCREPTDSHFLSAFTKKNHAINWAYALHRNNHYPFKKILIYEIDMTRLGAETRWFDAEWTTKKLGIDYAYGEDEIFIFRHILAACISVPQTLAEVHWESVFMFIFPPVSRRVILVDVDTDSTGSGGDRTKDEDGEDDEDGDRSEDERDSEDGYECGYEDSGSESDATTDEIIWA